MNNNLLNPLDTTSAFYLRVMLNRKHEGSLDPLLSILPEHTVALLKKENTDQKEFSEVFKDPEEIFSMLHYSWIAEDLNKRSDLDKPLFLAALPKELQGPIAKTLNMTLPKVAIKGPLKRYLQIETLKTLLPSDYIPFNYMPRVDLSTLINCPKNTLIDIISFLGLYDLAEEIKKIVDTKLIKNIFLALSQKQQEFVKSCLHQKAQLQAPRISLKEWSGDAKELQTTLHKRGLFRFAKALSDQPPLLRWLLTRKLDTGRGKRLESMLTEGQNTLITAIMTTQVLQLKKFLEKG